MVKAYQASGERLGLSIWPVEIKTPEDIEPAFSKIAQDGGNGVIRGGRAARLFSVSVLVYRSCAQDPGAGSCWEEVPAGLLMSYGQDLPDFFRRAVAYTDRILKGAKPADLPVEQPTKFKLVLNLKTAKAFGLTFPPCLSPAPTR